MRKSKEEDDWGWEEEASFFHSKKGLQLCLSNIHHFSLFFRKEFFSNKHFIKIALIRFLFTHNIFLSFVISLNLRRKKHILHLLASSCSWIQTCICKRTICKPKVVLYTYWQFCRCPTLVKFNLDFCVALFTKVGDRNVFDCLILV